MIHKKSEECEIASEKEKCKKKTEGTNVKAQK